MQLSFCQKKILDDLDNKSDQRFIREIKISAELGKRSPHIVKIKAYGIHNQSVPYYVMEFLQGTTLEYLLKTLVSPLELSRFLHLTLQITTALKVAHQGIYINGHYYPVVHRNLEPSNIFITLDLAGKEFVKVLDYGLAKLIGYESKLTKTTGQVIGTLSYTSPEQIQGNKLDHRSDLYSLGVLMYQMLARRLPWDLKQASLHRNNFSLWYQIHCVDPPLPFDRSLNVSPALEEMVMACLEKDPQNRPLRVMDIIQVLESLELSDSTAQPRIEISQHLNQRSNPNSDFSISWPSDKPIAKIIFPKTISTATGKQLGLWVMLPPADLDALNLENLQSPQCSFLSCLTPYPLIGWTVAVPELNSGSQQFFSCFLDLKQENTTTILKFLVRQKEFKFIMFSLETPEQAKFVKNCTVDSLNLSTLQELLENCKNFSYSGSIVEAKSKLRQQVQLLYNPPDLTANSSGTPQKIPTNLKVNNSTHSPLPSNHKICHRNIFSSVIKPFLGLPCHSLKMWLSRFYPAKE